MDLKIIAQGAKEISALLQATPTDTEEVRFEELEKITINGVDIYYNSSTNGGGLHRQEFFVHALNTLYPGRVFDHCLDWCAGVGFIGLSILANNLCQQLTCIEQYRPAVDICWHTVTKLPKHLSTKVAVSHSDTIQSLFAEQQYDLIVGNPPWSPGQLLTATDQRLFADRNWKAHRDFFANVKKRLAPNGVIMLVEGITVSGPGDFNRMITGNGLAIDQVFIFPGPVVSSWFMTIKHSD